MGLFDKKFCDICGAKIGLFGNRKLADGNLCKECAAKLSPWFSERRQSTVAEIKEQLAYREENRQAVAAFHVTRTLGEGTKLLLDEDAGRFMVAKTNHLAEENPDVLASSEITGCNLDIDENSYEMTTLDSQGKQVSYSPKRYRYSYDFHIVIHVNAKYFDEIRYQLNPVTVGVEVQERSFLMPQAGAGKNSPEYQQYEKMGNEIVEVLMKQRQGVREEQEMASQPKQAVTCPHCGATTCGDANGCCEFCGGSLSDRP